MKRIPTKQIDGDVAIGRNVALGGDATVQGSMRIGHDLRVEGYLEARNIKGSEKGFFPSRERLESRYPNPEDGWWALVGDRLPAHLYVAYEGRWTGAYEEDGSPTLAGSPTLEVERFEELLGEIGETARIAKEKAEGIITSKGKPSGIAPLDADGKVGAAFLPRPWSVVEFSGFVDGNPEVTMGSCSGQGFVVFCRESGCFVFQALFPSGYYANWEGADRFGGHGDRGRSPVAGLLYVDTVSGRGYQWSGSELTEVCRWLRLGESEDTAYRGSEGKRLRMDFDAYAKARVGMINIDALNEHGDPLVSLQDALTYVPEVLREEGSIVRFTLERRNALGVVEREICMYERIPSGDGEEADWDDVSRWRRFGGEREDGRLSFLFSHELISVSEYAPVSPDCCEELPGHGPREGIFFNRRAGAFFNADGSLADTGPGGYNEITEDGKVRASTKRVFVCGQTEYRYTGYELSRLCDERSPGLRHVFKNVHIKSQAGLVYSCERGMILFKYVNPERLSLAGMYLDKEYREGGRIRLSEMKLMVLDGDTCVLRPASEEEAYIEDEHIVFLEPLLHGARYALVDPDLKDCLMMVRYDAAGNKIFSVIEEGTGYNFRHIRFSKHIRRQSRNVEAGDLKFHIMKEDLRSTKLALPHKKNLQVQIWKRKRCRKKGKNYSGWSRGEACSNEGHYFPDANGYRYNDLHLFTIRGRHALIRARYRSEGGRWSDWSYFNLRLKNRYSEDMETEIKICQSVQRVKN